MSIVFNYIQKYPQRTKQLLGISHEQYQGLLKAALNEHIKIQTEKEKHKIRINSRGGGRKELLSSGQQICLCLFYLRQIPTFEILGMLFGVSKSEAHITFHYWIKILREILPCSLLEQVEDRTYATVTVRSLSSSIRVL